MYYTSRTDFARTWNLNGSWTIQQTRQDQVIIVRDEVVEVQDLDRTWRTRRLELARVNEMITIHEAMRCMRPHLIKSFT